MIRINLAQLKDVGTIHSVEVKAQDFPLGLDDIKEYLGEENCVIYKAQIGTRIVGCLVGRVNSNTKKFQIIKLSVHPQFQGNLGVGTSLVERVMKDSWKRDNISVWLRVPNYKIDDPTDPDYIGDWLAKVGLKTAGVDHLQYYRYGVEWDGYRFEKLL
jgi:ribosomal protein S18 acetylase RimI-like enzyme